MLGFSEAADCWGPHHRSACGSEAVAYTARGRRALHNDWAVWLVSTLPQVTEAMINRVFGNSGENQPGPSMWWTHAGTAGKAEKGDPRLGKRWHTSTRSDRRTELLNGRAPNARQATGEWRDAHIRIVVRSAPPRRLVCAYGAHRGQVVRLGGSQPRPQVWTVRTALL